MTQVVSFEDYVPLARHDGLPWTKARLQETDDPVNGTWSTIETKTLSPVDSDPADPQIRNLTTVLATRTRGWYRIIFEDAAGHLQDPTEPFLNQEDPANTFKPLISDVGSLLRARTKDTVGNELGTFTEETRPTGLQVYNLIDIAAGDVVALVDSDIPVSTYRLASGVIALGAAMLVELSYFPEQVRSGNSAYPEYERMYDKYLARLQLAVEREAQEDVTGEAVDTGLAQFSFPAAEPLWPKAM